MKIHHRAFISSRKAIVIAVIIVLATVCVGWWVAAAQQWQGLATEASQQSKTATTLKKQALAGDGTRESHSKAISALADLEKGNCEGSWWFNWQTAVWVGSKAAQNTCKTAYSRVAGLSEAAAPLQKYLSDEVAITDQLSRLVIDIKSKNWQTKARSASSAVYTELTALELDKTVTPVLKEAVKRVKEVKDAWTALKAADSKKDRTTYESALNRLDDAYVQLASITELSDKQLTTLVGTLDTTK